MMNQFFAPVAEPVGAVWCLMIGGVLWLLFRRQWRSAMWLGFPTLLLFIVGSTPVAEMLVAAEEKPWVDEARLTAIPNLRQASTKNSRPAASKSQPTADPADAVIALGGGQYVSRHDVLGFAMSEGGSRVLTAIELVRSGQARTLVLGGSWPMPDQPSVPSMCVVEAWINTWGLAGGAVTNLGICLNTHDEAVAFRKLTTGQSWSRVLLVTSALHLRRAVALFRKQGIAVTAVAADFQVQGVSQDLPFSPFPRQHRLHLMTLYLHEEIGWWIYRSRGWV